jgi:hypothetical protein
MDGWHPINVRAESQDVVRRWAQLEGKSPSMREELAERYASRKGARHMRLSNAVICFELIAVALKTWWHIYGG